MPRTSLGGAGHRARVPISSAIIRPVWKGFLLLMLSVSLRADALDEAAHLLAVKIASRLSAQERARIIIRNLSGMPVSAVARVRSTIETALHKPAAHRTLVDIALTVSENSAGFLLVAEIHKPNAETVEMEPLKLPPAPQLLTTQPALSKRLLWQQSDPILDLIQTSDHMLLLQPQSLVALEQRDKQWQPIDQFPLEAARIRDPRGRLEMQSNDVVAYLPGITCRGTWQPIHLTCEPRNSDFDIGSARVHFVPARNVLDGFPSTQFDDELPVCNAKRLAATAAKEDETETLEIFDGPAAISDALPLPGRLTALWPSSGGALAIVHNRSTNQYAAYAITVDCGQ